VSSTFCFLSSWIFDQFHSGLYSENEQLRSQIASMQAQDSPRAQTSAPAHHHQQQAQVQQQQYYSDQNANYAQTAQPDPRYSRTSPVQIYSDETPRSHKRRAVQVEQYVFFALREIYLG